MSENERTDPTQPPDVTPDNLPSSRESTPSDRRLQRSIRALFRDRQLPNWQELEIHVHGGVATISGEVTSFYQKQLAISCCQHVAGVLQVVDNVAVKKK